MHESLLVRRALPLALSYILLIGAAIALDYLFHILHLVWVGRYLGISGTVLLLLSFSYSARKRKLTKVGSLKLFLRLHEDFGWIGTLMILVHSGVHFNAVLPWVATAFMMVVTASGHIGQYLLKRVRTELKQKKLAAGNQTVSDKALEKELYWDSLTVGAVEEWRRVHMPLVSFFLALMLVHILSIFFLWNWR